MTEYHAARMDAFTTWRMRGMICMIVGFLLSTPVFMLTNGLPVAAVACATVLFLCVSFAVTLLSWMQTPVCYEVTDEVIVIVCHQARKTIPLSGVTRISRANISKIAMTIGVVSALVNRSVGIFALTGYCRVWGIGLVSAWLTNGHYTLLIEAAERYLISPEDPDGFVADVNGRVAKLRVATG